MCERADHGGGEPQPVHIPEEALSAAGAASLTAVERATEATPSKDPHDVDPDEVIAVIAATVEAAAPEIVAAELRRLSDEIALLASGYHQLQQRADQLDLGRGDPAVNTRRLINQRSNSEVASVVLMCTACQHTWEPNLLDPTDRSEAASTGCPLCGGWTWIGETTEPSQAQRSTANPSTTRSTPR